MNQTGQSRVKPPKYLFFTIGGGIFATKLGEIKEVVNDLEIGEVPLNNAYTVGMSSLRGEIISLLSLNSLLSLPHGAGNTPAQCGSNEVKEATKSERITLVVEHKSLKYGLLIDKIIQVESIDQDQYKEANEQEWIQGHYSLGSRIATILNIPSLMQCQCP